ncbi:probable isoaspartyl peptidase/L-asparaginase GA20639 [Chironomus tepperi]|uniref:probable isoaspartyl peptidase/L-asparaginase GA20639 n=1 Tax=Chironomus tepperi TaxID=113505 RepID=UPI00391F349B
MKQLIFIQSCFILFIACQAIDPTVICHGGAGSVDPSRYVGKFKGTVLAVQLGYQKLKESGNALDAVEIAIKSMEVDENFNAGYGAVLTSDGEVEMDACIMDGSNMKVGAITGMQDIFHPITLARRVMEKTKYNFLGPKGAMDLAKKEGFEFLPKGTLATQRAKDSLERWRQAQNVSLGEMVGEGGTVGCVAIDANGNVVAGTSTGGLTGKMPGRIGDTPIVGAGTYADNYMGGLSATGTGEVIMKSVLIYDILKRVNLTEITIQKAAQDACDEMLERYEDDGGVIGVDRYGNTAIAFSSEQMSWAYQNKDNEIHYGINKGDDFLYNIAECKNKNCFV